MDLEHFYIDGKWVKPTVPKFMDRVNPATEQVTGRIALGSATDVKAAVAAAKRAFETYQMTSPAERITLFEAVIDGIYKRRDEIVTAIMNDIGAAAWIAKGYHVDMALDHFVEMVRLLKEYPFKYMMGDSVVQREAFGVCGLITAWNWPAQIIAIKLAPALAAGCTVVWKPSEFSCETSVIIAEIIHDAGFPPGVFNMVYGDGVGVGAPLSSAQGIDLVSFTGSKNAGVAISKAAADTVKSVHLELGGKSANIILPDADLQQAVPDGVRRAYFNSGQSCIAPTRMLVHKDKLAEVEEIACATANAMVVGDPFSEGTILGPLVNEAQFNRVQDFIQSGIDEGAKLACGGLGRPKDCNHGYFVKPTVFTNVRQGMRIVDEEIFGPVLCILSYSDVDEAIQIANNSKFGLAGYVYSNSSANADAVAAKLKAGRIFINGAANNAVAPWGGYKESGNGRETGVFGLESYLEVKGILGHSRLAS